MEGAVLIAVIKLHHHVSLVQVGLTELERLLRVNLVQLHIGVILQTLDAVDLKNQHLIRFCESDLDPLSVKHQLHNRIELFLLIHKGKELFGFSGALLVGVVHEPSELLLAAPDAFLLALGIFLCVFHVFEDSGLAFLCGSDFGPAVLGALDLHALVI